jgi:hypothetical protein
MDKKIAIFDQKRYFFQLIFFQFLVIKTLDQDLDPDSLEQLDPDPESMNPDPQHWL